MTLSLVSKLVVVSKFVTSDGKEFSQTAEALAHEKTLIIAKRLKAIKFSNAAWDQDDRGTPTLELDELVPYLTTYASEIEAALRMAALEYSEVANSLPVQDV